MKALLKSGLICGSAALTVAALSNVNEAKACGPNPYVGTICLTAANFCPREYMPADGRLLPISEYDLTYAVVGNTYGGDSRQNFGIPDARARELIHSGQGPGLDHIRQGEITGFDTAKIPSLYFPKHKHEVDLSQAQISTSVKASANGATLHTPGSNYFADTTNIAANYANAPSNLMAAGTVTATTESASGSLSVTGTTPNATQAAMSAIGPQLGLTVCVAVDGQFPPRP